LKRDVHFYTCQLVDTTLKVLHLPKKENYRLTVANVKLHGVST